MVVAHVRPLWSRDLLIGTAVELLRDGGAGHRHRRCGDHRRPGIPCHDVPPVPNCGELVAAAFRELVPPNPAAPTTGDWRDRPTAVLAQQAQQVTDSPHLVAGLCWLALERGASTRLDEVLLPDEDGAVERRALGERMRDWCIAPLYEVLDSPQVTADWSHVVVSAFAQAHA
ncbi:hypothetical protein BH11ACT6_BH11ACT6_39390 [soil metagenome]